MSENTKAFIVSAIQTFVATFLSVLGATLATGSVEWTGAFWSSILLVAVRAAVKAVFQKTSIPILGGQR
jgi:hypothetical protein